MARVFAGGSSQYLIATGLSSFSQPVTFSAWIYPTSIAQTCIMSCSHATGIKLIQMYLTAAGKIACYADAGAGFVNLIGTTVMSTNTWYHVAARLKSGDYQIWLNGVSEGTSSTAVAVTGLTEICVATRRYSGSLGEYFSGRVADACVYGAGLITAQIEPMGLGLRTAEQSAAASIMAHYPLGGLRPDNDRDQWSRAYDLTAVNSPTSADHPRLWYPSEPQIMQASAAATSTKYSWWAWGTYGSV